MTVMTDAEMAERLERGEAGIDLLNAASCRIYALSANVALLKASLAQAEREAEKPAARRPTEAAVREACEILERIKGAHSSWGGWTGTPSNCDAAINLLRYRDSSDAPDRVAELTAEVADLKREIDGMDAQLRVANAEVERLREHAELNQQANRAASELPEGYCIRIDLELGAGSVYLFDAGSDAVELAGGQGSLAMDLSEAIDVAVAVAYKVAQS